MPQTPRRSTHHLVAAGRRWRVHDHERRARSRSRPPRTTRSSSRTPSPCAPPTGQHPNHVDVTVTVTDVDEDEELLLSARRPLIGADYTAAFEVGKGDAVQSPMWVWARSMSLSGPWADITVAATAATYVPVGADRDHYLRVTVSYDDGHGHGQGAKTLQATSELPTLPDIPNNMPPVFPTPCSRAARPASRSTRTRPRERSSAWRRRRPTRSSARSTTPSRLPASPPIRRSRSTPPRGRSGSPDGAALDHEDQDSYSVTVTAEDEYNATGTATFDITIEDVNERPVAVFDMPGDRARTQPPPSPSSRTTSTRTTATP